jgi:hypothetical protein
MNGAAGGCAGLLPCVRTSAFYRCFLEKDSLNTGLEAGFLPHRREGGMLVKKRAVAGNDQMRDKKDRHGVPGINASKENHPLIAVCIILNVFPGCWQKEA